MEFDNQKVMRNFPKANLGLINKMTICLSYVDAYVIRFCEFEKLCVTKVIYAFNIWDMIVSKPQKSEFIHKHS